MQLSTTIGFTGETPCLVAPTAGTGSTIAVVSTQAGFVPSEVDHMAMFVIEREFADQLNLDADAVKGTIEYNDAHELKWLFSFLSTDRTKTYCLYEAQSPEALLRQANDLGLPADAIIEVTEINPEMYTAGPSATGDLAS